MDPEVSLVPLGGLIVEEGSDQGLVVAVGERPVVVGRETGIEVRLTDTSCSRRHIKVLPDPAGRIVLEDLGSANGTFVNGQQIKHAVLQPDDRIVIGETTIRFVSESDLVEALRRRTLRVAEKDPVTGVCSRRLFDMRLRTEVALASRGGAVFSVAAVGVDRLEFHRTGGDAADRIRRAVGLALNGYLRENDLLAAWDDDLFVALIMDPSPNSAYLAAERMCAGVESLAVDVGGQLAAVTASVGVASERGRRGLTPESVVDRALAELDRAREVGGNCVSRWVHPSAREPIPSVSGDLRGTVIATSRATPVFGQSGAPPGTRKPGGKPG